MTRVRITVLGCGNSTGVPAIGNYWGTCDPAEPKNRRLRSSISIQTAKTTLVVDTGPDFREQLNRAEIKTIDAALYTHAHGDHINGIDELRVITFRNKKLTPIYVNKDTLEELQTRFSYLFKGGNSRLYPPILDPVLITQYGVPLKHGDIEFTPFLQDHGTCETIGYRFGDCGYSVDIKTLDDTATKTLQGIKTWIVDCAGYKDSNNEVHASIDAVINLNQIIGAEQTYLTSLTLSMDYEILRRELPKGYLPAHDGLVIETDL